MCFTRYEIRTFYQRCFYEGGDTFDYTPFDNNIQEVLDYIDKHEELKTSEESYVCRVKLFSDYDSCQKLATTKEYWELHQRGII